MSPSIQLKSFENEHIGNKKIFAVIFISLFHLKQYPKCTITFVRKTLTQNIQVKRSKKKFFFNETSTGKGIGTLIIK